ncbi:TauD/TfdA dioxygenase family protein [Mesorhizobium sp. B4-1-4]|uniref:TauD/TfdA dioxygenase family protein n=1 Tax=Mesorhizobium sp. B4-1-4 TaxID=2589888 RepID=UPI001126E2C6|nr:TauD/TfdA family dioxygenase [Mesorhizobium sp. B4-1-4]UCI32039.1 TauD/TfdA family dioxygenase [Mesorhizobium sp. B4-1-4]
MQTAKPLSPMLGADVTGIDLNELLNDNDNRIEQIKGLVAAHKVLRFRGQQLGPGELVRLAGRFGPIRSLRRANSAGTVHIPEHPQIKVVSNVSRDGTVLGDGGSSENAWHTDGSYLDTPTALTFLYGRKAPTRHPPKTYFMDLQAVYDSLPKVLSDFIAPLKAIHYSESSYATEYAADIQALPEGADRRHIGPKHPLVRRDLATGRLSLFPPRQRGCLIEGLSAQESEKLSNVLWSIIERFDSYWGDSIEPDDLMLFDNRFSLHRREAFDALEERILWHVTTDGERPQ